MKTFREAGIRVSLDPREAAWREGLSGVPGIIDTLWRAGARAGSRIGESVFPIEAVAEVSRWPSRDEAR